MFDSVRTRPQRDTSRWLAVAFAAACLHAATVAAVVRWQAGHGGPSSSSELPEVTFFAPLSKPGPAPGPAPVQPEPERPKPVRKTKRPELVAPAVVPDVVPEPAPVSEPPAEEPEPVPAEGPTDGTEQDVGTGGTDGTGTGPPGSTGSGTGTGTGGSGDGSDAVLPFGEGMTKPECDRAAAPIEYTREALEAQVEGLLIIRCTVRAEGSVESCQLVKGLPHMSEVALRQVSKWKCRPATFQGRPVSIDYFFNIRLTMPR